MHKWFYHSQNLFVPFFLPACEKDLMTKVPKKACMEFEEVGTLSEAVIIIFKRRRKNDKKTIKGTVEEVEGKWFSIHVVLSCSGKSKRITKKNEIAEEKTQLCQP